MLMGMGLIFSIPGAANATAPCNGIDLFPRLKIETPAVFGDIQKRAETLPARRGRFYKITSPGKEPSFLLGTLHLADARLIVLSPEIESALVKSREVLLELSDVGSGQSSMSKMSIAEREETFWAKPGNTISTLMNREEIDKLSTIIADHHISTAIAMKVKASVLALLLDIPPCAKQKGEKAAYIDALVADMARERNIPVIGLETVKEQIDSLEGLSADEERQLLLAVMIQDENSADVTETSIDRYIESDLGGLVAWMRSPEPIPGSKTSGMPPSFLDRLLDIRTRRMFDRALPALEKGNVFLAVGAAHLPGKNGLVWLLRLRGFQLDLIE
jgi:uncharacterized protein YbaP (TraB family)